MLVISLIIRTASLTFPVGTRLKPVSLSFTTQIQLNEMGGGAVVQLSSAPSGELIVKTNENQWDECEGTLLAVRCVFVIVLLSLVRSRSVTIGTMRRAFRGSIFAMCCIDTT